MLIGHLYVLFGKSVYLVPLFSPLCTDSSSVRLSQQIPVVRVLPAVEMVAQRARAEELSVSKKPEENE